MKANITPAGQKFEHGTFVFIDLKGDPSRTHFEDQTFAIIESTYGSRCGGDNHKSYSLIVKQETGEWSWAAWYQEDDLTEVTDPHHCIELQKDYNWNKSK